MSKDGYGLEARKQLGDLVEVYQLCHEGWGALLAKVRTETKQINWLVLVSICGLTKPPTLSYRQSYTFSALSLSMST